MQLRQLHPENLNPDADIQVEAVGAATLYFVYHGRFARKSVRTRGYISGCIHTRLLSAARFAEELRTRFPIVQIEQRPALVIMAGIHVLFVTQLNTENPFSNLRPSALQLGEPSPAPTSEVAPPVARMTLPEVVERFHAQSAFWDRSPPASEPVLLLMPSEDGVQVNRLDRVDEGPLMTYSSYSYGRKRELCWERRASRVRSNAVLQLVRAASVPIVELTRPSGSWLL